MVVTINSVTEKVKPRVASSDTAVKHKIVAYSRNPKPEIVIGIFAVRMIMGTKNAIERSILESNDRKMHILIIIKIL
jgi:hypothetical protein